MINILFKEIFLASIIGSILFAFISCMKQLLKKLLDVTSSYRLWFLMILCLLIPFIPVNAPDFIKYNTPKAAEAPVDNIVKNINAIEIVQLAKDNINKNAYDKEIVLGDKTNFDINVYASIWLCGVMVYLIYMCAVNYKIRKMIAESKQDLDSDTLNVFNKCKHKMGIKKEITIASIEAIEQPCIYGFFKPVVLLSNKCLVKLSLSQKEYICIHELSHYLRKDNLTNWLLIALRIVYWFNPIIGYAINRMKEDCELVCDALTLSYINYNEHQKYAMTIIDLLDSALKTRYVLTTVSIINGRKRIERRINMIYDFKNPTKLKRFASCLVAFLIAGVSITTIYAFNNAENNFEDAVESNITNESNADKSTQEMTFTWPVPSYKTITSNYGLRSRSVYCTEEIDGKENIVYEECEIGNIKILAPKIEQDTLDNRVAFHNGIDIQAPIDEKIVASENGTILYSGFDNEYGKTIIINHEEENYSIYAHCNKLLVKEGEVITKGQEIAKSGSTGQSTGPHVHFSIVMDNKIKNPMEYLNVENLSEEN
ncbi:MULTISPECIES: M56 family metallopeptidase [unclassified Sedimentibacter]|uniref:M56 family metallopeptidase n=1 Tax=unclassified Sedimentibacter TaxID=2649220 RepID=UPI0027DF6BCE|nr:M56 family metallopeptidase [Sedimentibacter sp. MB35-C1]WMJ76886.1 M56 family metallopeptidase [Sedimentibacter sp. MB35-C1]